MSGNERSFPISVTGANTGEQYRGTFKVKIRLSHRDTLKMNGFRRDLLGGNADGNSMDAVATAQVFSKVWTHIVDAPSWWKDSGNGLDLQDEEPVMELLKCIQEFEKEAGDALKKKGEEARKELQEELKKES